MLGWLGLLGHGHDPSVVPSIVWQAWSSETCQRCCWCWCLLGCRVRVLRICVILRAVHMLAVFRPAVLLAMLPLSAVAAVPFESHSFLLVRVLALAVLLALALASVSIGAGPPSSYPHFRPLPETPQRLRAPSRAASRVWAFTNRRALIAGGDPSVMMALLTMSGNVSRDTVSNS